MHVHKGTQAGPRLIQFHRMWGEHEDFMLLVSRTYNEAIYFSSPMDKVVKKSHLLKAALHTWNKKIFRDINRRLTNSLRIFRGCSMIFQ